MIPEVSLNSEFQILIVEKKSGSQKLDSENLISVQLQGPSEINQNYHPVFK